MLSLNINILDLVLVILLEFNANTISIKIINNMKLQFYSYTWKSVDTKVQPNKNDERPYKPPLQNRAQWAGWAPRGRWDWKTSRRKEEYLRHKVILWQISWYSLECWSVTHNVISPLRNNLTKSMCPFFFGNFLKFTKHSLFIEDKSWISTWHWRGQWTVTVSLTAWLNVFTWGIEVTLVLV